MTPSAWGLVLLLTGTIIRLGGAYLFYFWPDRISILPILVGVCVAIGGWRALHWAWPGIAFLVFMLPLPSQLQGMLAHPLQRVATISATYLLQTMGLPAQAEGNIILLTEVELGVVEACSGLRMLVAFFAVATAVVLLLRPPLWQALVVLVSAIPIAVVCNVTRLVVTGILHETVSAEVAQRVFHDWAGWLMMPLASGLLYLELIFLSRLITVAPLPKGSTLVRMALGDRPLAPVAGRTTSPPDRVSAAR
jgi:exosortase